MKNTKSLLGLLLGAITLTAMLIGCGGGGGTGGAGGAGTNGTGGGAGGSYSSSILSFFVGNLGGVGNVDGIGAGASFRAPEGVATDSVGNIYVADRDNHTIRKITPAGVVTTLAGTPGIVGSADGTGASASFNYPTGVATDKTGNVYVADSFNNVIRKITPAGVVTTFAGTAKVGGGSADGTGAAASFSGPLAVATDGADNVYVADTSNHTIRKITPAGVVTTFAGAVSLTGGSADGTGAAASFRFPMGVATDSAGNVYVSDGNNMTVRKITPAGVVTTLAGTAGITGSVNGTGPAASFLNPRGIATDSTGNIYVADGYAIRMITPAGVVSTLAGAGYVNGHADGTGAAASFSTLGGVATDSGGNVYAGDIVNNTIRKITPAGVVTTLAGSANITGSADGTGAAAGFSNPCAVAADNAGNIYVADTGNGTIRKITPAGVVTTLAGTAGVIGSADGTGAAASFNNPYGIATDNAGNIYVADNASSIIRKITPGGVVTTLAGTAGVFGNADGTGAAASFSRPQGIATDSAGNVYVADTYNSLIRKITPAGVVTTLPGTNVRGPFSVATDSANNVYVADTVNNAVVKIAPTGVVKTLGSYFQPVDIEVDSAGNIYVVSDAIYKITPAGVGTIVVGAVGKAGFTAGALPGALPSATSIAISGTTLYIAAANGMAVVKPRP